MCFGFVHRYVPHHHTLILQLCHVRSFVSIVHSMEFQSSTIPLVPLQSELSVRQDLYNSSHPWSALDVVCVQDDVKILTDIHVKQVFLENITSYLGQSVIGINYKAELVRNLWIFTLLKLW